jgi:hypothetical protein
VAGTVEVQVAGMAGGVEAVFMAAGTVEKFAGDAFAVVTDAGIEKFRTRPHGANPCGEQLLVRFGPHKIMDALARESVRLSLCACAKELAATRNKRVLTLVGMGSTPSLTRFCFFARCLKQSLEWDDVEVVLTMPQD